MGTSPVPTDEADEVGEDRTVQPSTKLEERDWNPGDTRPYRAFETATWIGSGASTWDRASADVLRWRVKTRSGFTVGADREVEPGQRLTIRARVAFFTVDEPVEVVAVVRQRDLVGFSYRTLPGHPVRGEEAFIVYRDGEDVFLTIRSLTAPASRGFWRLAYPLLRVAQLIARNRYRRALR